MLPFGGFHGDPCGSLGTHGILGRGKNLLCFTLEEVKLSDSATGRGGQELWVYEKSPLFVTSTNELSSRSSILFWVLWVADGSGAGRRVFTWWGVERGEKGAKPKPR